MCEISHYHLHTLRDRNWKFPDCVQVLYFLVTLGLVFWQIYQPASTRKVSIPPKYSLETLKQLVLPSLNAQHQPLEHCTTVTLAFFGTCKLTLLGSSTLRWQTAKVLNIILLNELSVYTRNIIATQTFQINRLSALTSSTPGG